MATAAAIIRRSLRLIGALAAGETPSATEQADGLEALNAMLDSWRTESLAVYALRDETITLTGAASYTIGPAGNLNTTRPVKIESAYERIGSVDYPLRQVSAAVWSSIADKAATSNLADLCYYLPSVPLGVLYLYPIPSAGGVVHLVTWTPFAALAASDTVALPPGYEDALTYSLAVRLAPEYGRPVSAEVAALSRATKDNIQRLNFRAPVMDTGMGAGRRYDIGSDA